MVDGEAKRKSQQLLGIECRSVGLNCQHSDRVNTSLAPSDLLPSNMQLEEPPDIVSFMREYSSKEAPQYMHWDNQLTYNATLLTLSVFHQLVVGGAKFARL